MQGNNIISTLCWHGVEWDGIPVQAGDGSLARLNRRLSSPAQAGSLAEGGGRSSAELGSKLLAVGGEGLGTLGRRQGGQLCSARQGEVAGWAG